MRTHLIVAVAAVATMLAGCSRPATGGGINTSKQPPAFFASDFDSLAGPVWRGSLEYIDYSSGKPTTIPSTFRVTRLPAGPDGAPSWSLATGYDDEPHADSASTLRLLEGGAAIQSGDTIERVVLRHFDGDACEVITEYRGEDDNRPATIRRKFRFSESEFAIRKLVKHDDAADYFKRHAYQWRRE